MELYIQFGYGMMNMSEQLIHDWKSGIVILSPRDLKYEQIERVSKAINENNGRVVLDPQFYMPHGDHVRLISHPFWPNDYQSALFESQAIRDMLRVLEIDYNQKFDSLFFILPGTYTSAIDEDWNDFNSLIINEARNININRPLYATICLSTEVMRSEEQVHLAIEYIDEWNIDGCYLVPEPQKTITSSMIPSG